MKRKNEATGILLCLISPFQLVCLGRP